MRTKAWTGCAPGKSPHVRQGHGRTGLADARRGHEPGRGRRVLRRQSQRGEGAAARLPRRPARVAPSDAKEEPLNEAERAAYEAAMNENMLLRAVLDDLKGAGSHPGSMSNRRKCELGERLSSNLSRYHRSPGLVPAISKRRYRE